MDQMGNSLRVAYENWIDEERFAAILRLLRSYPCGVGQVALFSQSYHAPLPLDELKRRAGIMRVRLETIRQAGLSGGINLLCTIGHHNENLERCFAGQANHMTNIRGQICRGSFCMRDERYRRIYLEPVYTALAQAAPDFIWIDDDVRCAHIPVGAGCYCDLCIAAFNEKRGSSYTRETLRQALNGGDIPLRLAWLAHNSAAIADLLRFLGHTVRRISPEITMGYMTGERYFEGYDFPAFADALSDGGRYPIQWRPGGGAYTDYSMELFLDKMREIGRQTAFLPDYVRVIQSEIENFPFQLPKKSPLYTAAEAELYQLGGCSGAAFNILPSESGEPVENIRRHFQAIQSRSAQYSMLLEQLRGMRPAGVAPGWKPTAQAYTQGEWADAYPEACLTYGKEFTGCGLPERFDNGGDCRLLNGFAASMLTDDEALDILSGGVYMDAQALGILNDRGFSEYTGFRMGRAIPADAIESYTADALNQGFVGGRRNCRQAFYQGMSISLLPTGDRCRTLCRLVDYAGEELADCSLGLFENRIGGRIAVGGYYPFSWISDASKTRQLTRLMRYLSRDTLPSYVDDCCRIKNMTFLGGGHIRAVLFNPNPDVLEQVPLAIRTDRTTAVLHHGATAQPLEAQRYDGAYRIFVIPEIPPFTSALVAL